MSIDKAEIERIIEKFRETGRYGLFMDWMSLADHLESQAAEIERLRAELANKKHCPGIPHPGCDYLTVLDSYAEENQRLSDDIDRLQALVDERGRKMEMMWNYMQYTPENCSHTEQEYFLHQNPEAADWFNSDDGSVK